MTETPAIHGHVEPGFESVREAFAANFTLDGPCREVGAAMTAYAGDRLVADLWGGSTDRSGATSWRRDTLINVWSSTKAVTATAVARLVDEGQVDYDAPVASYWPEFAAAGKDAITVGQLMSHQAGLPGFVEPTSVEDQCDFAGCAGKLARQAPAWTPGEASSYHAMTYGWLAGEVVRRVSGVSAGTYVAQSICGPIGADIAIGLPEAQEGRVATIYAPTVEPDAAAMAAMPPAALMALTNPGQNPEAPNARAWRAAEIPAANGQASAAGLARLFAALLGGGAVDGVRIMTSDGVKRMIAPAAPAGRTDMLLGFTDSWGMGMAINTPGIYGPNPRAFGHSGWGGSFGCADPDAGVAIGYVCNQMGPDLVGDPRTDGLCKAVIESATRR
jgi:CubicO group peptidase (beta-lactamase class C family)